MTLQEYTDPNREHTRAVKVELKPEEYHRGLTIQTTGHPDQTQIFLGFKGFAGEFILIGESGFLKTTDGDGNPKASSVFFIDKLKEKTTPEELQSIKAINSIKLDLCKRIGNRQQKINALQLMCEHHREQYGKDFFPVHLKKELTTKK